MKSKKQEPLDHYSEHASQRMRDLKAAKDWLEWNGNKSVATKHLKRTIDIAEQNPWYTICCMMSVVLYRLENELRSGQRGTSDRNLMDIEDALQMSEQLSRAESQYE